LGVPIDEIAFAQDFETDLQRAALFKATREGRKRIVFGSTERLGTGANVQDLVKAMHNLDVPWRPSDLEQRDGRGLRDGNCNDEIYVKRYVTESTFDAYLWQTAETKAKFILQVMDPDMKLRSIEDISVATLSYAEVKAAACGDPEVIERIQIEADLAKLDLLHRSHQSQLRTKRYELGYQRDDAASLEARAATLARFEAQWQAGDVPASVEMLGRGADAGEVYALLIAGVKHEGFGTTTVRVGTFGPYQLRAEISSRETVLLAEREGVNVPLGGARTARGFALALQAFGTLLHSELERVTNRADERRRAIAVLEAELDGRWEHEERFERLRARLDELDRKFAIGRSEDVAGLENEAGGGSTEGAVEEADDEETAVAE